MIISRKRFEKEVRRRAKRMYRDTCTDTALEMAADKIAALEKRIAKLEKQAQKQKGEIKGYYLKEVTPNETVKSDS